MYWYDADLQIERQDGPFEKNGIFYPSSVFTLWSEQERNDLGIYQLELDTYPDENLYKIVGYSYSLTNNIYTRHYVTEDLTQQEKDDLYIIKKTDFVTKLTKNINQKLTDTDWTQAADIVDIKGRYWVSLWAQYRKALRDLLIAETENNNTDITSVVYPDKPIIGETPINRYLVSKLVIIDRLYEANAFDYAMSALGGPGNYAYERWAAASYIYSDDVNVIGLLQAIGANPSEILAPEGDTIDP